MLCALCSLISEFPHNNTAMYTFKLLRLLYDSILQCRRPYRLSHRRPSERVTVPKVFLDTVGIEEITSERIEVCFPRRFMEHKQRSEDHESKNDEDKIPRKSGW